jgi:hypothetical protein
MKYTSLEIFWYSDVFILKSFNLIQEFWVKSTEQYPKELIL